LKKTKESNSEEDMQLGFWQLLKSTLSAFLGVQSTANRERDFRHGKLSHFIWMGLLFGLAFVLTLIGVVQLVMHFASNQG
jgi:diacylglycerol kinase